jgi:RNase P/RNase MRP subunit p29
MKKLMFGALLLGGLSMSFTTFNTESNDRIESVETKGGSITLINDTSNKLRIHTGSGETTLNPRGGKTRFTCNPGKSVKADGKVIFKVTDAMCGTTIKLSKYM